MRKYFVCLFLIVVLLVVEYGNAGAADCTSYTSGNTYQWLLSNQWGGNRVNNFPVGLIDYHGWCLYRQGSVTGNFYVRLRRVSDNAIIGTFGSMAVSSVTVNAAWYYFTTDVINPVVQDVRFTCERDTGNQNLYIYSKHATVDQVQTSWNGSSWTDLSGHVGMFYTCWTPTVVNVLTVDGVNKVTFVQTDSVSIWGLKSLDSVG